jgi:hypothetical protein
VKLVPTTATATEKFRRRAKEARKATGSSLAVALDSVAREHGYANWKHVTACVEATPTQTVVFPPLPPILADARAADLKQFPPSPETVDAFARGLLFAMDVKDAEEMRPEDDVIECEDAWLLAAGDMWRVLAFATDDTDIPLANRVEPDELHRIAMDDIGNYRFYRYAGTPTPTTLDQAFARVLGRTFFPPVYVWLSGRFIDMATVPEVSVDERVIYTSAPGGSAGTMSSYRQPQPTPAPQADGRPARDGLIFRLDVVRHDAGLYEARITYHDQEIDTSIGYASISEAIQSAADITGDVRGFEVAYQGLVIGTYPIGAIRESAAEIADRAVSTRGAFRDG